MKYSIIIPTYNHCDDLLKPCIESLERYTDFSVTELIVVANGCTDNTLEYLESLNLPVKVVWSDQALGYTCAANLGIKAATGDYVVLLNNDTEILPSPRNYWLEQLARPFTNNNKMALTGSLKLHDHDIKQDFIVFCCAMIKRDIFDKIGLLDEIFNPGYGEDIDFTMRVLDNGYQYECIDETTLIDGMNVGQYPLWHKGNKTFSEIPEYSNHIVHRNRYILIDRYITNRKKFNKKYSIVIPTYNHCNDLLKPCIESIQKYTDLTDVEVIVVANGCVDNTKEYVDSLGAGFNLVWIDEAAGYTRATNAGIKAARGEYVVLMNNDIELLAQPVNQWLDLLVNPFADSTVGVTGPVKFSWDCGGIDREAMAFWLVMIKNELFQEIGILDEIFSPGMGEDGDFCIRAAEAGYKLISVPNDVTGEFEVGIKNLSFPVFHKGNGTFADDVSLKDSVIDRNNKILDFRWGKKSKDPVEISIVIPTSKNFENALKLSLDAVLKYTDLTNKEVIVVANGSPEESRDYLNSLSDKVHYIWIDEPAGVIRAYNEGITKSRGKYVVLLDDDSILQPQAMDQWIHILQKPFLEQPLVGATGPFAHEYEDMGFVLHSGCAMYDAALLKRIGMFDETFNPGYFSDPDVSMRIWRAGYKCLEVPAHDPNKKYVNNMFSINFPIVHTGAVQTMDKNKDIEIVRKNREILYLRYGKKMISPRLELMYNYYMNTPIDIHEHMPTLRKYASECKHITEFGTRFVVSTYAFMAGKPEKLLTYDIVPDLAIWDAAAIAKENNIEFGFMERDTTAVEIEPTELLFIDTLHSYKQLKTELALHSDKVSKYIIFHDTETFGRIDEATGEAGGLMTALEEFLATNKSWKLKEHYTNCNGLSVIERVKNVKYTVVIPTYNHCDDLLKPCIESIQRYSDMSEVEIIVVANGCVDHTKEYVESLGAAAKLIWVPEAIGYTKATNLGIKAATGDYIILLNNDTELIPQAHNTWLDMLTAPFISDSSTGISGPLQLYDNYANSMVMIFFCVMIKREVFDKIGLLDEIFSPGGGEDIDFTVRANQAGYTSKLVTESAYSQAAGTNVGSFPIWHKDNRTFRDIPEYSKVIVKRNGLINCKRYNKAIKLNLGAGGIEYPGYLSVDMYDSRAHVSMDITKLDFDDNSVTEILASHVFEHLNPYKSIEILSDWLRVLKPGGKLIMEMPNIEALCARFANASTGERYGILNAIYGSVNTTDSGVPGDITSPHLFGWWPQSMYDHLVNSGYTNIVFMDEKIPHPESNFRVEASKPQAVNNDDVYEFDHDYLRSEDDGSHRDIWETNGYGIDPSEISGKNVIDVGANCGMFTMRCLELGAEHIYAVEAQSTIYRDKLTKNVGHYRRVTLLNRAIAEVNDKTVFIENEHYMSKVGETGEPVQSITLEKVVSSYNLPEDDLVLKIDCEGSEFNVIMTSSKQFMRKFSVIYAEFHGNLNPNPAWQNVSLLEQRLESFGFKCMANNQLFGMPADKPWVPLNVYMQKWVRI